MPHTTLQTTDTLPTLRTRLNTELDELYTADAAKIAKAIATAKGDLIGASASATVARLAVGTNGQVLTADSGETLGIKWATPSAAAFGYSAVSITVAGNTDVAGSSSLRTVNLSVAAGTYTATVTIPLAGAVAGNLVRVNLTVAGHATTHPTLSVRNATSGGTELFSVTGAVAATYGDLWFVFNGTAWVAAAPNIVAVATAGTLAGLSDVELTSPADTEVLTFDSGAGKWVNAAGGGGGGGGASSETPTNLSAFTAPTRRYSAASRAASANGAALSTWQDLSVAGDDAAQTGSARPKKQVLGEFNVIRFDGVDDDMRFTQVTDVGNFTCVAVLKKGPNAGIVLGAVGGDAGEQLLAITDPTAGAYTYDNEASPVQLSSDAMDLTSLAIVTVRVSSHVAAFTFNGTSAGGGSGFGLTVPLNAGVIGSTDPTGVSAAGFSAMDLAELIFWDTAITDLASVVTALKAHYGIA